MKAPHRIETARLILRKPAVADAEAVFTRYANDAEVTKYVGWPRHQSVEEAQAFLRFSESEWDLWPAGPYLIESRGDGKLLGSTGFGFESPSLAMTGYVLAKDSWGKGYATEALTAILGLSQLIKLERLYALCHADNKASLRVLEKCRFRLEMRLDPGVVFPNLDSNSGAACLRYVWR